MSSFSNAPFTEAERLREFVAVVDDLKSSSLNDRLLSQRIVVTWTGNDRTAARLLNFEDEQARSFLLMFRLLVQDNDGISLRRTSELIATGNFSDEVKNEALKARYSYRLSMDSGEPFSGESWEKVRDTFLWGAYAHRCQSPEIRRQFQAWERDAENFVLRLSAFMVTLKITLDFASELADVACRALEEIGSP